MPVRKPKKPWNAAVATIDGKTYLIGRPAIEDNYAGYLMEADGLSMGHAIEKARAEDVEFWVHEQIIEPEWATLGALIERPTYEQLIGKAELASDRDVRFVTI